MNENKDQFKLKKTYFFQVPIKEGKMTILENSSTQRLIDLDNLLYNDFNTDQDWFDAFKDEDKIRIELIESIHEKLKANNYDGLCYVLVR